MASLFTLVKEKINRKNIIYINYSYIAIIKPCELNNVKNFLYKTYEVDSYDFIK